MSKLLKTAFAIGISLGTLVLDEELGFTTEAQAVIGRPLTPGSVAGVARRTTRRVYRRSYVGAGIVGAGSYYYGGRYGIGGVGYPYYSGYNYPYQYGSVYYSYPDQYPHGTGYEGYEYPYSVYAPFSTYSYSYSYPRYRYYRRWGY
jgi:hypothetical protein